MCFLPFQNIFLHFLPLLCWVVTKHYNYDKYNSQRLAPFREETKAEIENWSIKSRWSSRSRLHIISIVFISQSAYSLFYHSLKSQERTRWWYTCCLHFQLSILVVIQMLYIFLKCVPFPASFYLFSSFQYSL